MDKYKQNNNNKLLLPPQLLDEILNTSHSRLDGLPERIRLLSTQSERYGKSLVLLEMETSLAANDPRPNPGMLNANGDQEMELASNLFELKLLNHRRTTWKAILDYTGSLMTEFPDVKSACTFSSRLFFQRQRLRMMKETLRRRYCDANAENNSMDFINSLAKTQALALLIAFSGWRWGFNPGWFNFEDLPLALREKIGKFFDPIFWQTNQQKIAQNYTSMFRQLLEPNVAETNSGMEVEKENLKSVPDFLNECAAKHVVVKQISSCVLPEYAIKSLHITEFVRKMSDQAILDVERQYFSNKNECEWTHSLMTDLQSSTNVH